ncbi:hypothetical protein K438DRAFT_1773253 [Mycena galopus ATCC 62051]|nr:hypothetical protein K438DRAFT_1773253 [Mycena galopus ATCC 62051]
MPRGGGRDGFLWLPVKFLIRCKHPARALPASATAGAFSTSAQYYPSSEPRKEDAVDLCIVGERPRRRKRRHSPFKSETGNETRNKANYITSTSSVVAWLGDIREEMGVEVYPARRERHAGQEGVRCSDARRRADTPAHEGVALPFRARATLLADAAHASLSKYGVAMYDFRHEKEAQMYGIGVKEAWRVEEQHVPVFIPFYSSGQRTPHPRLDALRTHLRREYHMADGLVSISLVVGLDYKNQYIES